MIYKSQNFTDGNILTAKQLTKMENGIIANGRLKTYVGSPSLYLPEILESKNIDDMTTDDLYSLYDELVATYPLWITREADLGSSVPLRHYCIKFQDPVVNGSSGDTITTNEWIADYDLDNILITMGVHGNEKSAIYGCYIFIRDLLSSEEAWATFIRSNFIIHFIPVINPWGYNNNSRTNEAGVNINRDYEDCVSEEAQSVVGLVTALGDKVKVIIDTHNTTANFGWMGGISDDLMFPVYREAYAKITGALLPWHQKVYNKTTKGSPYPYLFVKYSPNSGTMNYWGNVRGYICNTIEAPRQLSGGEANNQNSSPMLAALLGNLIQMYGVMERPNSNEKYTFAINPTPSSATVTLNGSQTNSIEVSDGTTVNWTVEAQGYGSQSGTYTVTDDYTMNITLGALVLDWQIGAINMEGDGSIMSSTTRQVTQNMFSNNEATKIVANGDFEFLIYAYSTRNVNSSIIGRLDNEGNFTKSAAGTTGQWLTTISLANYPSDYYYRLLCRCKSNTNQEFTEVVSNCATVS